MPSTPGPGPVGVEAQDGAAAGVDQPAGDLEHLVAQALGPGQPEVLAKAEPFGPAEQVLGQLDQEEPDLIGLEAAAGEVGQPTVLGILDLVLHQGVESVARFQIGDVRVLPVVDQRLVAEPAWIEEVVVGTGMGFFPPHQHPGPHGPLAEVEQRGDLRHLGYLTPEEFEGLPSSDNPATTLIGVGH